MNKKIVGLVCVLVLGFFLGGCDTKKDDGPVTITIWHDKEAVVADEVQKALDVLAPEITVVLEKKNGLTEALKMVGNDPNAAPDMYFFAHDKMGVYVEMGILSPITDFIDEEALEHHLKMTLEAATYKGEIYQLPLYFETLLFMYNRDYMADADVPATTEALYAYMQRNTRDGRFGFVEQHSNAYFAAGWFHGFGAKIIDLEGNPGLNSDEMIEALQYHLKFVRMMPGESEYATVNTLFREGKADSTIGGPWMVPTLRAAGINLGLAPMPMVEQTGRSIAPYSGIQGVHVLKVAGDRKGDAVTAVLNELLSPELGVALARASGSAPAHALAYEDPKVYEDEMVMMMRLTAENAVPMPNIPEMDVMWTVVNNLLVEVNMSGQDVLQSAEAAQKRALDLIANMR